jgi:hypothetical protein
MRNQIKDRTNAENQNKQYRGRRKKSQKHMKEDNTNLGESLI